MFDVTATVILPDKKSDFRVFEKKLQLHFAPYIGLTLLFDVDGAEFPIEEVCYFTQGTHKGSFLVIHQRGTDAEDAEMWQEAGFVEKPTEEGVQ